MATTPPATAGPPLVVPPLAQLRPPTWEELLTTPDRVFTLPDVPYGLFSAALFSSMDPPEVLLNKLEQTALESPVMVALVLDEDLDWITPEESQALCGQSGASNSIRWAHLWLLGA